MMCVGVRSIKKIRTEETFNSLDYINTFLLDKSSAKNIFLKKNKKTRGCLYGCQDSPLAGLVRFPGWNFFCLHEVRWPSKRILSQLK